MSIFVEAVIVAVAGILVTAILSGIKMLADMRGDLASLKPSVQALYRMQPPMVKALRYQNAAFRELGANGSTTKSDECLDVVDQELDRRLAERVGGCA